MASPVAAQRRITRRLTHAFLILMAALWMLPLVGGLYVSLRPRMETLRRGYFTWPDRLSFDNYRTAWVLGNFSDTYWNTALVLFPALFLTLFFSSMVAFAASRFSWRFNTGLLVLFTAGNLLPPQIIVHPLFGIYNRIPLPAFFADGEKLLGSNWGLIFIHVATQSGFCVFVMSNYMKLLPKELSEAALIDGASVWQQYRRVIMPLTRPVLAALAALEFTWIYNDFFWAVVLVQKGDDRPVTSSLNNFSGQFTTDQNLVAAGSVYVAIPTLLVFLALQRHFIAGLSLGATKG